MRIYYNNQCIYFTESATSLIEVERLTNAWTIRKPKPEDFKNIFLEFASSGFESLILEGDEYEMHRIFARHFALIKAAGGVVWNDKDELLMIHRLGKWDLPKGKLDPGEDLAMCAVREVEEETGLKEIIFSGFIKSTFHIYKLADDWILKQTEWYDLHAPNQALTPQAEEDIAQAIWVAKKDIAKHLDNSYPNIVFLLHDLWNV